MMRIPKHREPTHPDEMLLEEFLQPMDYTARAGVCDSCALPAN